MEIKEIVYLNGKFLRRDEARISPDDRGFLLGDGVFDTLRSYNGKLFRAARHFERFRRGREELGIEIGISDGDLEEIALEILKRNGGGDAVIRITVSRGVGGEGYLRAPNTSPTIYISSRALPDVSALRRSGIELELSPIPRPLPFLSVVKTTSCGAMALARLIAEPNETVMLEPSGRVAECSASSLLMIEKGGLVAPRSDNLLPSITREALAELFEMEERELAVEDLLGAEGLVVASSSSGPVPVKRFTEKKFRRFPQLVETIFARFDELVEAECGRS